ncbi:unnamed protein product [Vitrella brassicaformis CCMP3155]|uniref:Uncharacterized protein n=1 Tax=Vitrella brassicaformis (strain CCMP3155) TaxID=1169540 RepID=A0A0G4ETC6_VITBC|nr:unnamed protein product [Vitrella brassicaformis CCMP3155]|eukprot:CEM01698.1 unnamed protein product [Vitrella brassicaformis CCMP3155]
MGSFWSRTLWVQEADERRDLHVPRKIKRQEDIAGLREEIREEFQIGERTEVLLIDQQGIGGVLESDKVESVFGQRGKDIKEPMPWRRGRKRTLDDDDTTPVAVSRLSVVGGVDVNPRFQPKNTPIPGPIQHVQPFDGNTEIVEEASDYVKRILQRVVDEVNKVREDKLVVVECKTRYFESASSVPTRKDGWRYLKGSPGDLAIVPISAKDQHHEAFATSQAVVCEAKAGKYTGVSLSAFAKQLHGEMVLVRTWKRHSEQELEEIGDAVGVLCNGTEAFVYEFFAGYEKTDLVPSGGSVDVCGGAAATRRPMKTPKRYGRPSLLVCQRTSSATWPPSSLPRRLFVWPRSTRIPARRPPHQTLGMSRHFTMTSDEEETYRKVKGVRKMQHMGKIQTAHIESSCVPACVSRCLEASRLTLTRLTVIAPDRPRSAPPAPIDMRRPALPTHFPHIAHMTIQSVACLSHIRYCRWSFPYMRALQVGSIDESAYPKTELLDAMPIIERLEDAF